MSASHQPPTHRPTPGPLAPLAWCLLLVALALLTAASPGRSAGPPSAPSRVVVISVDGLRPDVLLRANAPALRALMARGSFTMWARTTALSVTLPSHVSMLTGVAPERHGIVWNTELPLVHPVYSARPTLFELAHAAGRTTAMAAGKPKFSALERPGSLDVSYVPEGSSVGDAVVADSAVRWITALRPQVLFVHLPDVDKAGHEFGWGSARQLDVVAAADRCVARMVQALRLAGLAESTVIIVSADHGGTGTTHGPDDPRSRTIPWIAAGPGIRRGLDLASIEGAEVRTEDTFATACVLLGLPLPDRLDGHVVEQALEAPPAASAPSGRAHDH